MAKGRRDTQVGFRKARLDGERRRNDHIPAVEVEIGRHWAYISSGEDGEALAHGELNAVRCFRLALFSGFRRGTDKTIG